MTIAPPPSRDVRPVILVVDDDPTITRMLELMLTRLLDAEVLVANRSFGLLNTIATHRPAAVLLDVMMPGLDGLAITGLIRADADLAATRVILYSALDEATLEKRTAECGADGYVQKGLRPSEVARKIKAFIGR